MGFFTKIKDKISNSVVAKVAAGAAIMALLGGGTVGLAYAGGLTGAKTAVGVALINTFVNDGGKLFSDIKEQGGEFMVECSGPGLPLEALGIGGGMSFPNTTLRLLAKSNPEEELNATLDLLVSDNVLLSANAYVNKEVWQITVPKLFSKVLTAEHRAKEVAEEFLSEGIPEELLEKIRRGYDGYLADIEIKQGRREEIRVNGNLYNCRVYQAELPAETVNFLAAEVLEEINAYGIEIEAVPEFTGNVSFTFHVCKERMVSIGVKWVTQTVENGETITHPGGMKMIPSPNGEFSLNIVMDGNEWNVKGYLKTAQNKILPLAGKKLEIFSVTKEEEAALNAEISKNLTRLMFRWMGLLR